MEKVRVGRRGGGELLPPCTELSVSRSKAQDPCEGPYVRGGLHLDNVSLPGGIRLEDVSHLDGSLEMRQIRCPRRGHRRLGPAPHPLEQHTVRRITVDLRPVLGQVMTSSEGQWDSSVSESEGTASLRAERSKQRGERAEHQGPVFRPERSVGEGNLGIYLPPIVRSPEGRGAARERHRRVNLVGVTDDGSLTCHPEPKSCNPPPVCFPRVILNQGPSQKTPEKHRSLEYMSAGWRTMEKLQLSELVQAVRERADSRHHTLINLVLCSLREKQERDAGAQGNRASEDHTRGTIGNQRRRAQQERVILTWAKRS
ncbi:uncharacterized protein LOC142501492 [Ascaphus truei]|uniref:uncharacterized protein LOC142501492 n=1 Tax=Ascaphus truei TaxID=8439 RepID=UPI003F5A9A8E